MVSNEKFFSRMNAGEYGKTGSCRIASISIPYDDLCNALWEPFKNDQRDFPDDSDKVDVCWGIKSTENKDKVLIWNFKYGPIHTGVVAIKDVYVYSVYYTNKRFFDKLTKVIGWKPE